MRHQAILLLSVLLIAATTMCLAQEVKGFRGDLLGQLSFAEKQILDLENSIPVEKMTWRPAAGVRSISEVYSHIAFGNYLLGKFAGFAVPKGVSVDGPQDGEKWQSMSTDKKAIHDQIVKSFDHLRAGVTAMTDADLDKTVTFFGQPMTVRSVLMTMLTHQHEHLGQSIAYARSVGVVPPWTAAREAQQQKK